MSAADNNLFVGYAAASEVTGEKSHAELYNPPGSNIVLKVTSLRVNTGNTDTLILAHHNAALADDISGVNYLKLSGNRNVGSGPAPRGEMYWETPAAAGELGTEIARFSFVTPNELPELLVSGPVFIEEGLALLVRHETSGLDLHVTFEWEEI
jgi:hypothetical protein